MKLWRSRSKRLLVTTLAISMLAFSPESTAAEEPLAVVVNPGNPVASLASAELRDIFLGRKTAWADGRRIVSINHKGASSERVLFERQVLDMGQEEVERHWVDERIRGKSGAPKEVPGSLVVRVIAKLPTSIAYLRISQVTDAVKVLAINDIKPTEAGYSLSR